MVLHDEAITDNVSFYLLMLRYQTTNFISIFSVAVPKIVTLLPTSACFPERNIIFPRIVSLKRIVETMSMSIIITNISHICLSFP